jgi:YVTN family beta-propeller protein
VHPEYALPAGIDLAVLILDGSLPEVSLAPALAGQDDDALYRTGSNVTMAGWGPTVINGASWDDLQVLTLPLVDPGGCFTEDRDSNADFACCRSNNRHSTPGDSGGPVNGGSQDSRKLVGVIEGSQGGASIATRVDKQASWIANPAHVHSYVVDSGPASVAVVPAANRKYVLHNGGTVSVLDTAWASPGKLHVAEAVHAIVGSPVGTSAYIADRKAVSTIDAGTDKVTGSVNISDRPSILAITPDGRFLADSHGGSVTILAAADLTIVKTFVIGNEPSAIAVGPASKHVYVTCTDDNAVRTIDISAPAMTSW